MAIIKKILLENGIETNYHRIVSINNIINSNTIIEVASYTGEEKRQEEKTATENKKKMNVFIDTNYYYFPYDEIEEILTVENAYKKIKGLDKFKKSKDD